MTNDELMALVNRSLFADLGFLDAEGKMCIRRVFCTWHKGLGRHLISTNTGSFHVRCLQERPDACLYFADSEAFEGLCLTGKVILHQEKAWKQLLWHEQDVQYYPRGVDDPDYTVLEFIAEEASYYRFDGKGKLTKQEIDGYLPDAEFEDGYARVHGKESL